MMYLMHEDGTRELHDSGLTAVVKNGALTQAMYAITDRMDPVAIVVRLGDPRSVGYAWQKDSNARWVGKLAGDVPMGTRFGTLHWAQDTAAFAPAPPTVRRKAREAS